MTAALALTLALPGGCRDVKRGLVQVLDAPYAPAVEGEAVEVRWTGADVARERLEVSLVPVITGLAQPTDVAFTRDRVLVCEKEGRLRWFEPVGSGGGELLALEVNTVSEQGLLGVALHPGFEDNGRLYLNYTTESGGRHVSRVEGFAVAEGFSSATSTGVVMEVEQPYQNHNAGQLAFGPDGMLYVGWGDGGFRFDPHGHGQDTSTLLGAMLRIDVDGGAPYAAPADNPLVGVGGARPEIWAWGFRNPWRYHFAPDGRLVVADVGQDLYEEVAIVGRGENHGWNIREGSRCFEPAEGCAAEGLVEPIYEYERIDGQSITGGVVYTGARLPALKGRYLFGDFISGRIWAIPLPSPPARVGDALALGQWPVLISAFARDPAGEVYVADYGRGVVYRIEPLHSP